MILLNQVDALQNHFRRDRICCASRRIITVCDIGEGVALAARSILYLKTKTVHIEVEVEKTTQKMNILIEYHTTRLYQYSLLHSKYIL